MSDEALPQSEFILYQTEDGRTRVQCRFENETLWLTQALISELCQVTVPILDDERLKNPDQPFDYIDELMRRIQDIRTSERRYYQKITDIYATSIYYDHTQEVSLLFFKTVQNKVIGPFPGRRRPKSGL